MENIIIAKNDRGSLEITYKAFDKVIKSSVESVLKDKTIPVEVKSEFSSANHLYILVKLTYQDPPKSLKIFQDQKIIQNLNKSIFCVLNAQPKNIAIVYQR